MIRKMVSIRKVQELLPIAEADAIEIARIDGWQCVVKKGEFQQHDLGVYFEIDSFLPIEPRYEFLRKSSYKKLMDGSEGFRLKTVKLRGVLSQGLLLPLQLFSELAGAQEGDEVTTTLRVTKYEPPLHPNLSGTARGTLPVFIHKTDQERIQNLPEYLEQFAAILFEVTIKLDGSSMTVYYNDGKNFSLKNAELPDLGVCSHGINLKEDARNSFWQVTRQGKLLEILRTYGKNIALQGELIGEGIQGNNDKIKGLGFYLFDIWDIDRQQYLIRKERLTTLEALNEIAQKMGAPPMTHVPYIAILSLAEAIAQHRSALPAGSRPMEALLKMADGPSLHPQVLREGLVFKSAELVNQEIVSFKVISNQYLLKEK